MTSCTYEDYVVTHRHTDTHKPTTITLRLRARVNNCRNKCENEPDDTMSKNRKTRMENSIHPTLIALSHLPIKIQCT